MAEYMFRIVKKETGKIDGTSRFENELKRAVYKKWLSTDSFSYFSFIERLANRHMIVDVSSLNAIERQQALMLYYDLFQEAGCYSSLQQMFDDLAKDALFCEELCEVVKLLKNRCEAFEMPDNSAQLHFPLKLHGVYTKASRRYTARRGRGLQNAT